MLPLPRGAVWQALFFLIVVLLTNEVDSEGRVVCYYTNWSVYRPGTAKFNPQNINPYLCTHLVYAFGGFTKDNQMKPFDKYQDIEQGGYAKFTGLKTYNKQLKTMIAIGGWNEASSRFSPLVANPERRQKFIKNILKFLRQNHFDGIDLDWEYPAHREGGKPRDRDNYAQFVQELRAEFEREAEKTGRPRLLLTMAVPAGIEYIDKGYDIPKLNKYLDWFNVLTYDFHSSHEPSVNHHAPLYSLEEESEYNYDSELNIDYSIKYYLKAGADRDKLVLGIPTYGRSYTLINEESTELGAPSEGPGEQGDATREKGYLAYYEICQNLKEDPEWTVVQPNPTAMGPYAYRRNQWVGYDDEDIVRKKAEYVVEQGLGGIMFWAIDNDDFRGSCTGKPYPLIEAAKEAMVEGLGLGVNEVSKPSSAKKPSRSRSRDNTSSTRNRIDGTTDDKLSVDQRKTTSRRPTSGPRKRVQSSTTNAPSTTIKLTEAEGSSLYIGGRTSTPPPPTTPDPGTDFKCEEEGFFQHPRDCKKYYWCLDSGPSGLGIVAHMFTCPSGLYFNPAADSCDFARNVPCKIKKATTASPVTTTTSTSTTTPRTTTASNRITAATSRTSLFRTTTTSTTAAPEEEEEYEDDEEETPTKDSKDKNAEEDPRVIKELIELIRKVGGIDELEKHLLHKEDGTISLKDNDTNSGTPTTQSSISKSLYDKVLSRPNAYNSFRNRLTTSTLFRNSAQIKTEEVEKKEGNTKFEEDILQQKSSSKVGSSKYSSVVRGNSRQGPQNEGLENLPEFDGFLKEKKEYVTINRQRGSYKAQYSKDEDNEENENEKEEQDEEVEIEDIRTTKKPSAITTPAYVSIRRSRPTTTLQPVIQNINNKEDTDELKTVEEVTEKKSYTSLNRYRGRPTTTTEKIESNDEVESTTTRYKHFERTRPTRITTTRTTGEKSDVDDKDDDNDDNDEEENKQNVTVQNKEENDSTQNTQTTTRIYASIGRRPITTTTSEPSITTTTEIPIAKTNLLETTYTPEPISTTTTTHTPITITNIPDIISNSFTPISSTTTSTTTTTTTTSTTPNGDPHLETTSISSTEINPYNMSDDTFALSLDINSLKQTDADSASNSIKNEADAVDGNQETATTTTQTTTKTLTTTGTTNIDHQQSIDEVTNLNKNISKTQYKYTTRTRNVTSFTTATNDKNTDTKISNENTQPSLIDIRSNIGLSSNSNKYVGGRRQQLNNLLNRKSQIQIQQTNETSITNTTTEPTSTNVFVGAVSSPRPFGFPRRRNRPSSFTTKIEDSKPVSENDEDAVLIKSKIYAQNANANTNKVSSSTDELQVQVNNLESNREGSTTRTKTISQEHVVNLVGNSGDSLRHVKGSSNSLSNRVVVRIDDEDDNDEDEDLKSRKFYTWRDARRPTKRTVKTKKVKVSEVSSQGHRSSGHFRLGTDVNNNNLGQNNNLDSNVKDENFVNKEHIALRTSKYRGKSLETKDIENEPYFNVNKFESLSLTLGHDENQNETTMTKAETEEKQEKNTLIDGKSNQNKGKLEKTENVDKLFSSNDVSLQGKTSTTQSTELETENRLLKSAEENVDAIQNEQKNNDILEASNLNATKTEKTEVLLETTDNLNIENSTDIHTTLKGDNDIIKTTNEDIILQSKINSTETAEVNNDGFEHSEKNQGETLETTMQKTKRNYSIARGETRRTESTSEDNTDLTTNHDTEEHKNGSENGRRSKYQVIRRRTDTNHRPTTETVHYQAITRLNNGVHLGEDQSSSFFRNLEEHIQQADDNKRKTYQTISRGGQIFEKTSDSQHFETNSNQKSAELTAEIEDIDKTINALPSTTLKSKTLIEDENIAAEIIDEDLEIPVVSTTVKDIETPTAVIVETTTTESTDKNKEEIHAEHSKVDSATEVDDLIVKETDAANLAKSVSFVKNLDNSSQGAFNKSLNETSTSNEGNLHRNTAILFRKVALKSRQNVNNTTNIETADFNKEENSANSLDNSSQEGLNKSSNENSASGEGNLHRNTAVLFRKVALKSRQSLNKTTNIETSDLNKEENSANSSQEGLNKSSNENSASSEGNLHRNTAGLFRKVALKSRQNLNKTTIETSDLSTKESSASQSRAKGELSIELNKSDEEVKITHDIVDDLNQQKTIARGTYRPNTKGDLSSLLAADDNKQHRARGNFHIRRRPVIETTTITEHTSSNENSLKLRTSSQAGDDNNNEHIKKTVFVRKRIYGQKGETQQNVDGLRINNSQNIIKTTVSTHFKTEVGNDEIEGKNNSEDEQAKLNLKVDVKTDTERNLTTTKFSLQNKDVNTSNHTTTSDDSVNTGTELQSGNVNSNNTQSSESTQFNSNILNQSRNRSRYSARSRASSQTVNTANNIDTQSRGKRITKTRTSSTETYNSGANKKKIVNRIHNKVVQEQGDDYEYEYEVITEKPSTTTQRPITRNRGSVKFQSNDLSSLLALDFAQKTNRRNENEKTIVKTRRRLIKKPPIITETEEVHEFETETETTDDDENENKIKSVRPIHPITQTSSTTLPTVRRTRPTRPLRTTTSVPVTIANEIIHSTTTPIPTTRVTKKTFAFNRPLIRQTTTSTPLSTEITSSTEKIASLEEHVSNVNKTLDSQKSTDGTQAHKVNFNSRKNIVGNLTNSVSHTSITGNSIEHKSSGTQTTDSSSAERFDVLKKQFTSAVNKLKSTETEESLIASKSVKTEVTPPNEYSEKSIVQQSIAEDNSISTNSGEDSLSLPIYHRRKYYQYYKDSPITYIDKILPADAETTTDLKKQIHSVFNISNNNLTTSAVSKEKEADSALEQAKEINSELDHFLLKTPGTSSDLETTADGSIVDGTEEITATIDVDELTAELDENSIFNDTHIHGNEIVPKTGDAKENAETYLNRERIIDDAKSLRNFVSRYRTTTVASIVNTKLHSKNITGISADEIEAKTQAIKEENNSGVKRVNRYRFRTTTEVPTSTAQTEESSLLNDSITTQRTYNILNRLRNRVTTSDIIDETTTENPIGSTRASHRTYAEGNVSKLKTTTEAIEINTKNRYRTRLTTAKPKDSQTTNISIDSKETDDDLIAEVDENIERNEVENSSQKVITSDDITTVINSDVTLKTAELLGTTRRPSIIKPSRKYSTNPVRTTISTVANDLDTSTERVLSTTRRSYVGVNRQHLKLTTPSDKVAKSEANETNYSHFNNRSDVQTNRHRALFIETTESIKSDSLTDTVLVDNTTTNKESSAELEGQIKNTTEDLTVKLDHLNESVELEILPTEVTIKETADPQNDTEVLIVEGKVVNETSTIDNTDLSNSTEIISTTPSEQDSELNDNEKKQDEIVITVPITYETTTIDNTDLSSSTETISTTTSEQDSDLNNNEEKQDEIVITIPNTTESNIVDNESKDNFTTDESLVENSSLSSKELIDIKNGTLDNKTDVVLNVEDYDVTSETLSEKEVIHTTNLLRNYTEEEKNIDSQKNIEIANFTVSDRRSYSRSNRFRTTSDHNNLDETTNEPLLDSINQIETTTSSSSITDDAEPKVEDPKLLTSDALDITPTVGPATDEKENIVKETELFPPANRNDQQQTTTTIDASTTDVAENELITGKDEIIEDSKLLSTSQSADEKENVEKETKLPSTTRRSFSRINQVQTTTTVAPETDNHESAAKEPELLPPTRRPFGRLNRLQTTAFPASTTDNEENNEEVSELPSSTRRTYASRNRFQTTTTLSTNDDENIENITKLPSTTRKSFSRFNQIQTTTTIAPETDDQESAEKEPDLIPPSRRPFGRNNRLQTTTLASSKTDNEENKEEESELPSTTHKTFTRTNRFQTTTSLPTDEEENVEKETELISTTRRSFSRINQIQTTTTTAPEINVEDNAEKESDSLPPTRRPFGRISRLQTTTFSTPTIDEGENEEQESDLHSTTHKTFARTNRFQTTTSQPTDDEENVEKETELISTTRRSFSRINQIQTTTTAAPEINDEDNAEKESDSLPPTRRPFGRISRLQTTTFSSPTTDEEENEEQESELNSTTQRTFARTNRFHTTTSQPTDNEENVEKETDLISTTRRSFGRINNIQTTTTISPEINDEDNVQIESDSLLPTRRPFGRINRLQTTSFTTPATDNEENEEGDSELSSTTRRYFSKINRLQTSTNPAPTNDNEENITEQSDTKSTTYRSFGRFTGLKTTTIKTDLNDEKNKIDDASEVESTDNGKIKGNFAAKASLPIIRNNNGKRPPFLALRTTTESQSTTDDDLIADIDEVVKDDENDSIHSKNETSNKHFETDTETTTNRLFGLLNRNRTLLSRTTVKPLENTVTENEHSEFESISTNRTYSRPNRIQSSTAIPVSDDDENVTTKRTFSRFNRLRTTTNSVNSADIELSTEKIDKAVTEQNLPTRKSFGRNSFRSTTVSTEDSPTRNPLLALKVQTTIKPIRPSFNRNLFNKSRKPVGETNEDISDEIKNSDSEDTIKPILKPFNFKRPTTTRKPYNFVRQNQNESENDDETYSDEEEYKENDEEDDESYDENSLENDNDNSVVSTTERNNLLQNLRNRVRISQTQDNKAEGVVNSRLKELLSSRTKETTTSNNIDRQTTSSYSDSDNSVINNSNTPTNKTVVRLFGNRSNTNRSSTVANYLSNTKTILSLVSNSSDNSNSNVNDLENNIDEEVISENIDENIDNNETGNELNSTRRFQKNQFNRTRTITSRIRTTTTLAPNADTASEYKSTEQVNELNIDEEAIESTATESTLNSSPTPTPRRYRVLKFRRPVGGAISSNTTILNISNASNNASAINVTNTVTNNLDHPNIVSNVVEQVDNVKSNTNIENQNIETTQISTETSALENVTPTKRYRKVVRKLIRPINQTLDTVTTAENTSTTTTQIPTTTNQRQYGARYGFNRSIGQSRLKNAEENQEKESINELVSVSKSDENKNNASRLQLYRNGNRSRFGSKGQPTTTTAIPDDKELEDENQDEDEKDDDQVNEEIKNIQTEKSSKESDESTDVQLVSTTEAVNDISEDNNELTAEIDDEDTEDEENKPTNDKTLVKTQTDSISEKKVELQTTSPKVKEERITGIVNNHLRTLLNRKANNTVQQLFNNSKLANSSVSENSTDLQRLRDKLKVEQAQGEKNEGVVSTRLKQLLEEKKLKSEEKDNNDDNDSTTEDEETETKTSIELNQSTVPSSRRPFIPKGRLSQINSSSNENSDLSAVTKSTPTVRPTFRRKLIAKRPYTPIKPSLSSISTTERPTAVKPKRKYVRRKFGRFHPFNANNRNSGEGFVRTDPRGSLLPGSNRFKVEGKQNGENSGSTDEEYDEYEYEDDDDEEAEEEEIEVKSKETVANKPIAPVRTNSILFNRQQNNILRKPIDNISTQTPTEEETTDNNSEIDENDEENEDESDEENTSSQEDTSAVTTNSNSPGFIPKNNRVLPGARPPLPTGVGGNVPFNPKNRPSSQPNRFGINSATSRYGSNARTTNRPRVINRPPGVAVPNLTLKPIDSGYERTTLLTPTKPAPFIQTNTRTYERKYTGPSTETPENFVDNSLIEDLNIEALNARNKKIFDINSKKHTTLKPKVNLPNQKSSQTDDEVEIQNSHQNTETSDESYTSFKDDQQGFITTTSRTQPQISGNTNNNYDLNVNEISSQDNDLVDNNLAATTPQTPATTLVHIFTLTDDEQTSSPPTASGAFVRTHLVPEKVKPKHKVVEINRIVEITSKEEKLRRKSKANQEFLEHIGTSNIKVESLPHLEQLGEISIAKYVHLVDSSDIEIDGHSTVTDYTPTEPTASKPTRNDIPAVDSQNDVQLNIGPAYVPQQAVNIGDDYSILHERSGKALIPEVIREAIETSTISLEGLFDNARKAKELNNVVVETAAQNTLLTTGNGESEINAEKLEANNQLLNIDFVRPAPVYNSITIAPVTQSSASEEISTAATEQISSETTTEKSLKATTVAAALFPTYVRPIVPLLRPESNESSPLVISIANLDKVILSKVMRNTDTENKNPEHTSKSTDTTTIEAPDSNAAFSSRIASIVKAPTNVIHEVDTETKQVTGSKTHDQGLSKINGVSVDVVEGSSSTKTDLSNSNESPSTLNSTVSKIVSVSTETHVVRKKKSRKHKSRHFTTTTSTTTNAPAAADDKGAQIEAVV